MLPGVRRAVVLAEALVLAGCASLDRAYYTVADAAESVFRVPHHTAPARVPPPPAPPAPTWNSAGTAETKAAAASEPPPVVVNGLSGTAVRSLLGQPSTQAGPAPGETWTYRSGGCEVELYLFPDVKHGGLQVLDYRVSGAGARNDAKQACLRRLRDGQSS